MRLPKEYLDNVEIYDDWVKSERWYTKEYITPIFEKYPLLILSPFLTSLLLLLLFSDYLRWDFSAVVIASILIWVFFVSIFDRVDGTIKMMKLLTPKYYRLKRYRNTYQNRVDTLNNYFNNFLSIVQSIQNEYSTENINKKILPQTINIINGNHQIISTLMPNINYMLQRAYKTYLKNYDSVLLLIEKQSVGKVRQAENIVIPQIDNTEPVLDKYMSNDFDLIIPEHIKEIKPKVAVELDIPKMDDDSFTFLPPKEINNEQDNTPKTPKPKVPSKRIRPNKTVNISPKDYTKDAIQKMELGEFGEKLVMQYERERVEREYGKAYLNKLQHSSKEVGDGLGYDITSYDGREVYIEVKTTRKNKLKNIPITSNEVAVMKQLGDNYYLYIVSELDTESIDWKLGIYKGAERVKNLFNITPVAYKLRAKQ